MLQELLNEHVLDPKNPEKLFRLAQEYDGLEQGAMAVSLYLKTADLTNDKQLQYKCMILLGKSYERQGGRNFTVEGAYHDAAALMPDRPEAHFFLSNHYCERGMWKQCLTHANLGLMAERVLPEIHVGYPGRKVLAFLNSMATWYIAGQQSGKHKLFDLKHKVILEGELKNRAEQMLKQIGYPDTIPYKKHDEHRLKHTFPGLQSIIKNYSKHFQDMFVLTKLNGKRNGTYLEIGSGQPFIHNNTALLETKFGWKGISVDNSPALCYQFKEERNNTVICLDATETNWEDLFEKHCVEPTFDYLQIDCDEASLDILKKLPFNTHKFGIITFEHDCYRLGTEIRDEARQILMQHGYKLVVSDVGFTPEHSYEDWYAHPDLVDIPSKLLATSNHVNFIFDYFMEPLTEKNELQI